MGRTPNESGPAAMGKTNINVCGFNDATWGCSTRPVPSAPAGGWGTGAIHILLAVERDLLKDFPAFMPDLPVIDAQAIENLRSLNPDDQDEFLREIVAIFLADTPQRLAELEQSLGAGDAARFSRAAHSIKGSSANLGAMALRQVAEQLEHQSRKSGLGEVAPQLEALKGQFDRARQELARLLAPAPDSGTR